MPDAAQTDALLAAATRPLVAAETWVAFSGGLDSTVLLHVLAANPGLRAVHVHHGLQPNADAWARHCVATCETLGVPLRVLKVQVPRDGGVGLEAAARGARYRALASLLQEGEALVTAHHRDDQAETFLLRALRGSGPDGLAAMARERPLGRGHLVRPWLGIAHATLVDYATRHGLQWIDDPTNADDAQDRNFLRNRVFPLLAERWPTALASFARSAELQAETRGLLEAGDALAMTQVRGAAPGILDMAALRSLGVVQRARVLRDWIKGLGLPPLPGNGVARIEHDLLPAAGDATPCFAWRDARVHGWRGGLHAGRAVVPLPKAYSAPWDGRLPLVLPNGDVLELEGVDAFPAALVVRARRGGEKIRLPGREHRHLLKHVLQERGIPPWDRPALPVLATPDGSVWAAGDAVQGDELAAWLQRHGARLRWRRLALEPPEGDAGVGTGRDTAADAGDGMIRRAIVTRGAQARQDRGAKTSVLAVPRRIRPA